MKVAIGEELRLFGPLHIFSMYLDSPDHPTPTPFDSSVGLDCGLGYEQMETSDRMLQSHADPIAPLLSRSVRVLRLVRREDKGGSWQVYRILPKRTRGTLFAPSEIMGALARYAQPHLEIRSDISSDSFTDYQTGLVY